MPLFKTPEDRLQAANDALLRGDYSGAADEYSSAAQAFSKKGRASDAQLANAHATLMRLANPSASVQDYAQVAQAFGPFSAMSLKLGPRVVPAGTLVQEASLTQEELSVLAQSSTTPQEAEQRGRRFQQLSLAYRQFGNQVLVLPELFRRGAVPAASKVPRFAAMAEECLGEAEIPRNPKRAAEHYQNAFNWWQQAGETSFASQASDRVRKYGSAVTCWFCGRQATGEGINFQGLASSIRDFEVKEEGSPLPGSNASQGIVYACRPCASTLEKVADDKASARTAELEIRINRMLATMRSQAGVAGQWIPTKVPP